MIRKDLLAAIPTSIAVGMAGGVLLGSEVPDVLVVGAALAVLVVWLLTAGYVGALIQRRRDADLLHERVQVAVELAREGEGQRLYDALRRQRADIEAQLAANEDALIEATKEDR